MSVKMRKPGYAGTKVSFSTRTASSENLSVVDGVADIPADFIATAQQLGWELVEGQSVPAGDSNAPSYTVEQRDAMREKVSTLTVANLKTLAVTIGVTALPDRKADIVDVLAHELLTAGKTPDEVDLLYEA